MNEDFNDETQGRSFVDKMKANPLVPVGIVGLTGVVGYSIFNFRKKKQTIALYLIHTRLAAQGTLVSCLTLGIVYTLIKSNLNKFYPEKKE